MSFITSGGGGASIGSPAFIEGSQDAVGPAFIDTSSVNFTYDDPSNTIYADVLPAGVDHNSLLNFVANKHIDHTAVTLTAGTGLSGGGDISASRTFNLANTAVVAGSYGSSSSVGTFTVDAQGRLTAAANAAISITSSNITDFNEAAQDAVGGILTDTSSVDFTYNDGANTISAVVLPAGVDHNSLANLTTGDPHTQYVLAAGDTMTGALLHPDGSVSAPSISFSGDVDTGVFHTVTANEIAVTCGGFQQLTFLRIVPGSYNGAITAGSFVQIRGDATGNISSFGFDGFLTSGIRPYAGSAALGLDASGTKWVVQTSGHFQATAHNTYDIGDGGSTAPRTIYVGTSVQNGPGNSGSPSYSFIADPNSGFYNSNPDEVSLSLNASQTLKFSGNDITLMGSSSADILWNTDSGGTIGANGATRPSAIYCAGKVAAGDGSGASPSITFDAQEDMGLFKLSSTELGFATDGVQRAKINSVQLGLSTVGMGLRIAEGSNARMGVSTLVGGTVTVSNTSITSNTRIFLTHQNNSGTPGFVTVSARTASTSFVITSSNGADTSDIAWFLMEPA